MRRSKNAPLMATSSALPSPSTPSTLCFAHLTMPLLHHPAMMHQYSSSNFSTRSPLLPPPSLQPPLSPSWMVVLQTLSVTRIHRAQARHYLIGPPNQCPRTPNPAMGQLQHPLFASHQRTLTFPTPWIGPRGPCPQTRHPTTGPHQRQQSHYLPQPALTCHNGCATNTLTLRHPIRL